jgi:hypothetical protein
VQQQTASQVARPPTTISSQQVNVLPLGSTGGKTMDTGFSPAIPPTRSGRQSIPFLSPTNTDNFLTLYSKMVYNIVDG